MIHSQFTPLRRWLTPCEPSAALTAALKGGLITGLLTAGLAAHAQPEARVGKLDPLDPKASVPAVTYESSLSRYRPLGDEKPVSWREANDTVARIGGWRVYAREAQQSDTAPVSKPAEPTPVTAPTGKADTPKPAGHGGHKPP